jgi:predicted transcriptional regulator
VEVTVRTLTIRINEGLEKELNAVAKETGQSKSAIVCEALRRQVAIQAYRRVRKNALPFAEAAVYLTDKDLFCDDLWDLPRN